MMREPFLLAGASLRGRRRLGLVATAFVLLLAAVGMAAGLTVTSQGAPLLDAAADDADVAHLVVYGDAGALTDIAADPEVTAFAGPFTTLGSPELIVGEEPVPIQMTALDGPDVPVNRPPITAGRWAQRAEEIVLDRSLAVDAGLEPGDAARFRIGVDTIEFEVVGTAVNFTDCFYPLCDPGRVWVTNDGLARAGSDGAYSQLWLRFDDAADADPFLERISAAGREGISGADSWLDTRGDFLTLDRIFGSFLAAFGVFVLVCSAVVVAGSTAVRIVARRREIGLLGAIGCRPRDIAASLVIENVVVGVVAVIVGWLLAGFAVPSLQVGIGATLGPQDPAWSLLSLVVSLVVVTVVLVVATLVPALRAARRPVTDVLRDVPPDRVSWISRRIGRVPDHLALLGVQETASQPTRSALAATAIAVAVIGTIASIGFIGAIEGVADDPARQGDPWDLTVAAAAGSETELEAVLDDTPSVGSWFGELERKATLDEGVFLTVAVGGDVADAGYRIGGGRTVGRGGEAIVGYGFLQRFDREIGDRVDVLVGTTPLSFEIVGWYRDNEDSGEVLRYPLDDLQRVEDVRPEVYRVRVAEGTDPATAAAELSTRLGPGVRIASVDTGLDDMQPFFFALRAIAGILIAVASVNLLTTLLTTNRESAGRIGVELAVGFTPGQITTQGAVAGATAGLLAALVGVPLGLLAFRIMADVVSTGIGAGPGWMPLPPVLPVVVLVMGTIVLTAGVGAFAVARLARRPASDLVRTE